MNTKPDPENYRKMSEPHTSQDAANKALQAFFDAVEKLRNEHHIQDVHVIAKTNAINKDGREQAGILSAHFGHMLEAAPMCAWSLGQAQAEYQQIVGEYLKGG